MIIFLIGFMGSGKSYVGERLAKSLKRPYIDLDTFIEQKEQRSIPELFKSEGEAYFRQVERQALRKASQQKEVVISCGGGTPCFFDNIDFMNASGLSVFLDTPVNILMERLLKETNHRPLLQSKSKTELEDYIATKLEERLPYYQKANLIYKQHTGKENIAQDLHQYLVDITGH